MMQKEPEQFLKRSWEKKRHLFASRECVHTAVIAVPFSDIPSALITGAASEICQSLLRSICHIPYIIWYIQHIIQLCCLPLTLRPRCARGALFIARQDNRKLERQRNAKNRERENQTCFLALLLWFFPFLLFRSSTVSSFVLLFMVLKVFIL